MADAAEEPVLAQLAYAGEWRIEPLESGETATFALRYQVSHRSERTALETLGLTSDALSGEAHPLRFEVSREAGTFTCEGSASGGRGSGAFRFRPDRSYALAIAETGMPPLTLRSQIRAGMFDVGSSFVRAIVGAGFPHVTFANLVGLKMARLTPDDVRGLHEAFPSEGLDEFVALAMIGVTPAYVGALQRAGVAALSADNVCALRASGVEQAFIENLATNGQHGRSIDEVASLRRNAG